MSCYLSTLKVCNVEWLTQYINIIRTYSQESNSYSRWEEDGSVEGAGNTETSTPIVALLLTSVRP